MWRLVIGLISIALFAQTPDPSGDLRRAIERDEFARATELAAKLDSEIQAQLRVYLLGDVNEQVEDALTWLPEDTESIWVNQEPFIVDADQSPKSLSGLPIHVYSLDRLATVNEGTIFRALSKRTVRFVIAAARNIRASAGGIPSSIPGHDVVYFYFLSEPLDLPVTNPSGHNWVAMARPDVLVLTNNETLLQETLTRIANGSKVRALPMDLAEWKQVDRHASFWGLRRAGVGVTAQFDAARQRLEIRFLGGPSPARAGMENEFLVGQPESGIWSLVSDIRARGPWPVHFAMDKLGFGLYP